MKRAFILLSIAVFSITFAAGQTFPYANAFTARHSFSGDSIHPGKKWIFSRYMALSTSYGFFKGGSVATVAMPVGVQFIRPLTSHLFAFAEASLAPAYSHFTTTSVLPGDFMKNGAANPFLQPSHVSMFSRAELGLGYTNDAHTFTISGSIGVEKSSYPVPYYPPTAGNTLPRHPPGNL